MEVQVFGTRKSSDARAALRFFAERRIKTHFVDLNERAASLGELRRFAQRFGVQALGEPFQLALCRARAASRRALRRALVGTARPRTAALAAAAGAPPA